ncbi:MAG: hypothetical protein ACRBBO_15335 [Cognatishimia sp.]
MDHLLSRSRQFLDHLELLGPVARTESFMHEALETGGSYVPARDGDDWASHLAEIDLHGFHASGASEEEAQRNWMRMARREMPIEGLRA